MIDLTPIAEALVVLILALVSRFVIPLLRSKVDAEKLASAREWAEVAVKAAEQLFSHEQAKEKKAFVQAFLTTKGFTLDFESLDTLIEASVLELHK